MILNFLKSNLLLFFFLYISFGYIVINIFVFFIFLENINIEINKYRITIDFIYLVVYCGVINALDKATIPRETLIVLSLITYLFHFANCSCHLYLFTRVLQSMVTHSFF